MPIKLKLDTAPVSLPDDPTDKGSEEILSAEQVLAKVEQLSPEEQQMVDQFVDQIDLSNPNVVLNYGASAQRDSASIATKTLSSVKTKDVGTVSDLLVQMVCTMDKAGNGPGGESRLARFFRKIGREGTKFIVSQETTEQTLDRIERELERHSLGLQADVTMLDDLYNENWETFKALTLYIEAGDKAVNEAKEGRLAELLNKASASGKPEDAIKAQEFSELIAEFERRLTDLRLTRTICLQSAPQISMIQRNDRGLIAKLQSAVINTLPLWRRQLALSIAQQHNIQTAQAANAVDDITNRMLRQQAATFHEGAVLSAQAINRQAIDSETIAFTTDEILAAVEQYLAIEKEGAKQREEAKKIIAASEQKLIGGIRKAANRSDTNPTRIVDV